MKNQITVEPTKGFLVPPVGKDFTARIRRVDEKGSHSMAVYGPTKEIALAKLMVEVDKQTGTWSDGTPIVLDESGMVVLEGIENEVCTWCLRADVKVDRCDVCGTHRQWETEVAF